MSQEASPLLGGLSPAAFLTRHWQKAPLLIRQAVPGFRGFLDGKAVLEQARRPETPSRLVRRRTAKRGDTWITEEGPLHLRPSDLGQRDWTVLVQGIESVDERGWELLQRFGFIPRARVDDLMVSYAVPGGGVGPHFDLYDVFLLQGSGRRRWRIKRTPEPLDDEGTGAAPSSPLADFVPDEEHVLEPGDMLYLPPRVAHDGVAEEPCTTWSIGFLAPSHEALVGEYLAYLGLRPPPLGIYADPDLVPAAAPAALPRAMVTSVSALLREALRVDDDDVGVFLGRLLTAPKPHVVFPRGRSLPAKALRAVVEKARGKGAELRLTPPSRALVDERRFFVNGDAFELDDDTKAWLSPLAETRRATLPRALPPWAERAVREWLRLGFAVLSDDER